MRNMKPLFEFELI